MINVAGARQNVVGTTRVDFDIMTKLEKATLLYLDETAHREIRAGTGEPLKASPYDIKFMYNPTEITLSRSLSIEQANGPRDQSGSNKTSFKHPNPYSLKISNIILDTYETGTSILPLIESFKNGVEFVEIQKSTARRSRGVRSHGRQAADNKRPPIYLFVWGNNKYLKCFIKQVTFKFTMFFPNGDPARAIIDLSLEQISEPDHRNSTGTPQISEADRKNNDRSSFL